MTQIDTTPDALDGYAAELNQFLILFGWPDNSIPVKALRSVAAEKRANQLPKENGTES